MGPDRYAVAVALAQWVCGIGGALLVALNIAVVMRVTMSMTRMKAAGINGQIRNAQLAKRRRGYWRLVAGGLAAFTAADVTGLRIYWLALALVVVTLASSMSDGLSEHVAELLAQDALRAERYREQQDRGQV